MIYGDTLTDIYEKTLDELKKAKEQESQFGDTLELINYSCCLKNPRSRFIGTQNRAHSLRYLIGELCWYLSGEKGIERISNYSTFWNHLVDEKNEVNSNYGYRAFHKCINRKNQFQWVVEELKKNRNSRRAILLLNLFEEDYSQMHKTKDFPCTIYLHFLVRNNKLNMLTYMRSNDFIYGFCNDVPFFTILQEILAVTLGIELGYYYHNAGSEHIYMRHFQLLNYEPAPLSRRVGEVFPIIQKADLDWVFEYLPNVERFIREGTTSSLESKNKPDFIRFIIEKLQEYWTPKI